MNCEKELAAANAKYQADLDALGEALGHWSMGIPGGFIATVCYHIRAMNAGIARLLLSGAITTEQAAEILGLPVSDVLAWVSSGQAHSAAQPSPQADAAPAPVSENPTAANGRSAA